MGTGTRPDRVAEEFREILAEEIPRLKDPRVGFVTITHVEVTSDLRHAIVYYTALGDDAARPAHARGPRCPRRRTCEPSLGHQVRMKYTPEVEFQEDVGLTQVERCRSCSGRSSRRRRGRPARASEAAEAARSDDAAESAGAPNDDPRDAGGAGSRRSSRCGRPWTGPPRCCPRRPGGPRLSRQPRSGCDRLHARRSPARSAARGAEVVLHLAERAARTARTGWSLVGDVAPIVERRASSRPAGQCMVSLDVASVDRLAALQGPRNRAGELIVIDHHVTNPGFGTINVIDPAASSSAEVALPADRADGALAAGRRPRLPVRGDRDRHRQVPVRAVDARDAPGRGRPPRARLRPCATGPGAVRGQHRSRTCGCSRSPRSSACSWCPRPGSVWSGRTSRERTSRGLGATMARDRRPHRRGADGPRGRRRVR